ncbi:MAG: hypothetical protein A2Y97_12285 [Nitrospirae bacterium RBG_13_39_12]|nr:MAG: hypothetical protein A2Y97_12285 [Nitrospirae bacterium RBG_13_39_12]
MPVILTLLIYELPAMIRRTKKLFYVPIYFSIYPLREINQNLSIYLGEDYMICAGCDLSEKEAEKLRKKIIFTSIVSASLDALVIPIVIGFIAAFYLPATVFTQFLVALVIYKIITVTNSLRTFHYYSIGSKRNLVFLAFIYIVYIGVAIEMLKTSYSWTKPFVLTGNWSGLWSALTAVVFGKIIAQGFVLAVFVAIFTNYIADREIRKKNVERNQ